MLVRRRHPDLHRSDDLGRPDRSASVRAALSSGRSHSRALTTESSGSTSVMGASSSYTAGMTGENRSNGVHFQLVNSSGPLASSRAWNRSDCATVLGCP